ncbi:hypothetical protein TNCV_529951 [Trichonephila clavipes]|nr:hypothetical protein TNCV_529951 [Trichonephila clavipes]
MGSGNLRQIRSREDLHNIRHERIVSNVSLFTIHTQIAPSLRASVSVRIIARHLDEGQWLSPCPLDVLPLTPTHTHTITSVWSGLALEGIGRNPAFAEQSRTTVTTGEMV